MDNFVEIILATLISIVSPGQSIYSQVAIDYCDEICQETPLCANPHDWRCKPPKFNKAIYDKKLEEYSPKEAKARSYTRPETYDEGIVRYAIIAQAISDVSESSTLNLCKQKCTDEQCHKDCMRTALWKGSRKELAFMIATVASQESGFRADVHGGTGSAGRGDCKYQYPDGTPAQPFAKGAIPIAGTCKSVCLGQINIGNGTTSQGWKAADLVGIDLESTKRCFTVVAQNLSRSRSYCNRLGGKDWAKGTFAAYGSGSSCTISQKRQVLINGIRTTQYAYKVKGDDGKIKIVWGVVPPDNAISKSPAEAVWPAERSRIFWDQMTHTKTLQDKTKMLLSDENAEKIHSALFNSSKAVLWPKEIKFSEYINASMKK